MKNTCKLGILVSSLGNFGQKGFYNAQEFGLARAMAPLCEEVTVYKCTSGLQEIQEERIEHCENGKVSFLPGKGFGINGFVDTNALDKNLDVLVYFSDTQLSVPRVAKWAKQNGVLLIPYVGAVKSHSNNKVVRMLIDTLFQRNLAVYRKHHCAVKTPAVREELLELGVADVTVAPVGLDLGLLNADYRASDTGMLKQKYGYSAQDRVLLFVGRMSEEKQPLRMVKLFAQLYRKDPSYRLFLVGTGELGDAVAAEVERLGFADRVRMMDRIANKDIWELYRIADCFVNLNQQEIFGMAILEAMYYGCKVVAWEAPGPSFILEDGVSGCLADSDDGILEAILEKAIDPEVAHQRIVTHFTWGRTAEQILSIAKNH